MLSLCASIAAGPGFDPWSESKILYKEENTSFCPSYQCFNFQHFLLNGNTIGAEWFCFLYTICGRIKSAPSSRLICCQTNEAPRHKETQGTCNSLLTDSELFSFYTRCQEESHHLSIFHTQNIARYPTDIDKPLLKTYVCEYMEDI